MDPPTLNEFLAILLARDIRPEDRTMLVGANMPMARAACVMANLTGNPDARIIIGLGVNGLGDGQEPPGVYPFLFDPRTLRAEAHMHPGLVFEDTRMLDVFFVGGLQLDQRGNINLFGIPDGHGGWKMRGPGGIAVASMSTHCAGYYIVMPEHSQRSFVKRVAYISALGDRAERARLALPGGGVRLVLSPLGVFDFDDAGDMRVRSLHAGVSDDDVVAATGFELVIPGTVPITPAPTTAELRLLRERVDLHRTLI
jgi:glutaconate CoA-transferase, subunit B